MRFHKYHALGNDYLVLELENQAAPSAALVRRLCDRHFGVGGDGILLGTDAGGQLGLRIFNPDGSEAEKSGNGLRIFARYLLDRGRVGDAPFDVATKGGRVRCQVHEGGRRIVVDMGRASFASAEIPVVGPPRDVVAEEIEAAGERLRFTGVTVGNPHCVVHVAEATAALAQRLGPLLERHEKFPHRTNVQLVQVLDRASLKIEIWERGAGYTLASGSSSCAAAAASVRLGLCDGDVTVAMPGGELSIVVAPDYAIRMSGPAAKVAEGTVAPELLHDLA